MNRRLFRLMVLGLGLGLGTCGLAQTAVPPSIKSAAMITDAARKSIADFVQSQVQLLDQPAGRDALVDAAGGDVSAAYLDVYATVLNQAMLSLADKKASLQTRLNAAIVTARVAEKANNIRLKPAAIQFMADSSDPIVLWGVKAAKALVPVQLRSQTAGQDPLISGLAEAIADNLSGPIVQEAYDTLSLNIYTGRSSVSPQMIQAVVPEMQELLAGRVALYSQGVPDNPQMDTRATNFLIDSDVWSQQSPQQRTTTVQLIVDLLSGAARRTASYDGGGTVVRDRKDQIIQTLRLVGSATRVVAAHQKSGAIEDAATPVMRVNVAIDSATIVRLTDELIAAILAEFPDVKQPDGQAIQPMALNR